MSNYYNDTLFILKAPVPNVNGSVPTWIVITPETTEMSVVRGAWSYAIKHSPLTLNVPDYPKAIELLKKRHPSWKVLGDFGKRVVDITFNLKFAHEDIPEVDVEE